MNNNLLFFLDKIASPLLLIFAVILRGKNLILNKIYPPSGEKILVIKLVGAGNFIPITDYINNPSVDILTLKENSATAKKFFPEAECLFIDSRDFVKIIISLFIAVLKITLRKYRLVINLEIDSSFAKFLTTLPLSLCVVGISSSHKSAIDIILYNHFIVSQGFLSRTDIFRALIGQVDFFSSEKKQQEIIGSTRLSPEKSYCIIAPSCSSTDANRRLSKNVWRIILAKISENIGMSFIVLPNQSDLQYEDLNDLAAEFSSVEIKFCAYNDFVDLVLNASFVVTVDSQVLHIAQYAGIRTLCFYGPTNPNGINLSKSTIIASRSLQCSPCTHLYFTPPCKNKAYCMDFDERYLAAKVKQLFG